MEDPLHALWSCPELDMVWGDADLWGFQLKERFLDFKALVSWLLKYGKATELFVITVWPIWNQRN